MIGNRKRFLPLLYEDLEVGVTAKGYWFGGSHFDI
jgi:hypothetical protein